MTGARPANGAPRFVVRLADRGDLLEVPSVEAAADTLFAPLGITDLPSPAGVEERAAAWRVLVVGRPVEGFAVLERVDDAVHLEQLAVRPAAGRQGRGAALLAAAVAEAGAARADRVTLLTYADIPWNGPWYAVHGWRELALLGPGLRALREREQRMGLDRYGRRIAMVRSVPTG